MNEQQQFEHFTALAFFASAFADQADECGQPLCGEIMDQLPDEINPAALHAAKTLRIDMVRLNRFSTDAMLHFIENHGDGGRPNTIEHFGHYAAMQAMGHGVGLRDAFGPDVHRMIRVPYVEFGSYALERDYFTAGE